MPSDHQILEVILKYCGNIEDAVSQYGDEEEEFQENIHYSQSCAFSLMQIGEAVKKLSPELIESNPQVQWKQIARFRDMIAHQYGHIDPSMLWISVIEEVPELKAECARILDTLT